MIVGVGVRDGIRPVRCQSTGGEEEGADQDPFGRPLGVSVGRNRDVRYGPTFNRDISLANTTSGRCVDGKARKLTYLV